ncbi:Metallo-dependent phosphatase, partial [Anaeromyces robustus]
MKLKIQNILLASLLVFQSVSGHALKKPNSESESDSDSDIENGTEIEKIFNYDFYCIKDNKKICSYLNKKVDEATNSLSTILDISSKVNFDVFVDDISKYRIDNSKEVLALALDMNFSPLNPKNDNVENPYPNSKAIKNKLNLKENEEITDKDFILVLNNFKSDKKYLSKLQDEVTLILLEIYEGLYTLDKLPYPYNEKKIDNQFSDVNALEMANTLLNVRKDEALIGSMATSNENKYKKFSDANHIPEIIHWEDTLLGRGFENFPKLKYKYKRTIAIGDVHGDFNKFERVLRHAKLIDENDDWIGTDSILVQVGDLTDRGPDFKQIIDLLIKLRAQAKEKGGIVYMMLGNHELYDMQAGYFMLAKSDIDAFGGLAAREKAISMEGEYGKLLRTDMNVTLVVDDTLFVHGGLTYEFAVRGIDEINKHAHEILTNAPAFDDILNNYYRKGQTHPLYTDPLFDMTNGPLWSKYYINTPEEESCPELEKVLKVTKAKRMIIGHTVQEYGHINTKCNNKLILIDVALSKCLGNYFGYVEILNNKREIWTR